MVLLILFVGLLIFCSPVGAPPSIDAQHCDFNPDVRSYLERLHSKMEILNEMPPSCPVTTGLLIAFHSIAHGKNDVVDRVIEMDTFKWIDVPAHTKTEDVIIVVDRMQTYFIEENV
jgi:hypothetical protein